MLRHLTLGVGVLLTLFSSIVYSADILTTGRWVFDPYDMRIATFDTNQPFINPDLNILGYQACENEAEYLVNTSWSNDGDGCYSTDQKGTATLLNAANGNFSCSVQYMTRTFTGKVDNRCTYNEVWEDKIYTPTAGYVLACEAGLVHVDVQNAGFISDITLPEIKQSLCIDGCNYDLEQNQQLVTYVNPAVSDQYGCTYAYNGNIYNCSYDAPVELSIGYLSTGEECTQDGIGAPITLPDPNAIDLSPIVDKQTETNNLLQNLNDFMHDGENTVPDSTELIDNDLTYLDLTDKINSIGDGSYLPFGTGFGAVFPTIAGAGECPDFDFEFHGVILDISNENSCKIMSLMTKFMDFIFFIITFLFVFYEWRDAMQRIL